MSVVRDIEPWDELLQAGRDDERLVMQSAVNRRPAQAVTEDAYASKTRLTISVRVKYTDHKQPKNSIDQSFSAFRDFDSSEMLTNVQDQLCEEITEELVMLIFNATAGNW